MAKQPTSASTCMYGSFRRASQGRGMAALSAAADRGIGLPLCPLSQPPGLRPDRHAPKSVRNIRDWLKRSLDYMLQELDRVCNALTGLI